MSATAGSFIGTYEVVGAIGAGGMGEVYRARDPRLDRDVAIKLLPAGVAANPSRRLQFEEEARAAGALNHPNLLTVYDVGTWQGTAYIVCELLQGETLRARFEAGRNPGAPDRRLRAGDPNLRPPSSREASAYVERQFGRDMACTPASSARPAAISGSRIDPVDRPPPMPRRSRTWMKASMAASAPQTTARSACWGFRSRAYCQGRFP